MVSEGNFSPDLRCRKKEGGDSYIVQIRVKTCAKEKAKYGGINSNYIDGAEHFLNLTGEFVSC